MLKKWEELPDSLRISEVRPYYEVLSKKAVFLLLKRLFDIIASILLLVVLSLPMAVIAVMIKIDSRGPVFFRQERVTRYGKVFRIHKFRTMVDNAEKIGSGITVKEDKRITRVGEKLRHARLDEFPQLIDVLEGNMTFVGTRPESVKYVSMYKPEYMATLLMPAGITSEASIQFRNEDELLINTDDADRVYVQEILPRKMEYNLDALKNISMKSDVYTMIKTVYGFCFS